jgi:hypothetical protein
VTTGVAPEHWGGSHFGLTIATLRDENQDSHEQHQQDYPGKDREWSPRLKGANGHLSHAVAQ